MISIPVAGIRPRLDEKDVDRNGDEQGLIDERCEPVKPGFPVFAVLLLSNRHVH